MTIGDMVTYDMIVEMGIATPDELDLARYLMSGSWEEVLNAVVHARTGYRTLQDCIDEEGEGE